MKLEEVICAVGVRTDWIRFHTKWNVDANGQIITTCLTNIALNSEVDVHYQWFWHCNPEVDTTEIYDAIEAHDYATFTKWFEMLELKSPIVYLPFDAQIWIEGVHVGDICIAFDKDTFQLITSQDHECG